MRPTKDAVQQRAGNAPVRMPKAPGLRLISFICNELEMIIMIRLWEKLRTPPRSRRSVHMCPGIRIELIFMIAA